MSEKPGKREQNGEILQQTKLVTISLFHFFRFYGNIRKKWNSQRNGIVNEKEYCHFCQ